MAPSTNAVQPPGSWRRILAALRSGASWTAGRDANQCIPTTGSDSHRVSIVELVDGIRRDRFGTRRWLTPVAHSWRRHVKARTALKQAMQRMLKRYLRSGWRATRTTVASWSSSLKVHTWRLVRHLQDLSRNNAILRHQQGTRCGPQCGDLGGIGHRDESLYIRWCPPDPLARQVSAGSDHVKLPHFKFDSNK